MWRSQPLSKPLVFTANNNLKITASFFWPDVGGLVGGSYHNQKKKKPRRGRLIKGRVRFSEGWIEFASRKKAKWVAEMCNNSPVGGKKSSPYYDCLWSIRYLGKRWVLCYCIMPLLWLFGDHQVATLAKGKCCAVASCFKYNVCGA